MHRYIYLTAAAVALVWAARHPHLAIFITLTVLAVVGYTVTGAIVYGFGDGGFTTIPGWGEEPWHTMVMAAAGRSGENRKKLFFKEDLNGDKKIKFTDSWWVHQLAPQVAAKRGITAARVIGLAEAEADRLISANAGQWQKYTDVLTRDGSFGDAT
jgi:hypothetical protein